MMKENKIPWFFPMVGEEENAAVLKVLESGYINDGEVTRSLETTFAAYLGCKHCIAVTSGTSALTLCLMALGVGQDDEVIIPDLTFIATANAVVLAGAKVKLVDVELNRFTIDPNKVRLAVGPRTKAIIAVDVNGRGADYDALESLCKEFGLFLICDSAEALGSKYQGRYLGTYGDAGCYSFSANKTVSSGQGGMIATDNTELYYRLRELKDQGRRFGGTGGDDIHPVIGFNFKYTNVLASIALAQFGRLPERLKLFQDRDQLYYEALKNCEEITLPPLSSELGEVRQWTDLLSEDRKLLERLFDENSIGYRPFWHPLHQQEPYRLPDDGFENSIRISKQGLWLPSSFAITKNDIEFVARVVNEAFAQEKINL
jgi:perosamine synthetase